MSSWDWITDRVAVGPAPGDFEAPEMVRQGITDVLDLRGEPRQGERGPDPAPYAGSGIAYHYDGMLDRGGPEPADKYVAGVQTIYDALARPHGKILVHCAAGVSRSPSMVYAYLRSTGVGADAAWNLIRSRHPSASRQYFGSAEGALPALPRGPSGGGASALLLAAAACVAAYLWLR